MDYGKSCTGSLLDMVTDARQAFDQCENNPACTGVDTSPDCNDIYSYRLCGFPITTRDSECSGRVYYKPGIIDGYNYVKYLSIFMKRKYYVHRSTMMYTLYRQDYYRYM